MTNQLSTEFGQTVNLQSKFAHVLQLWRESYLPEPLIALRAYISNAFDAYQNDEFKPIRVDIEEGAIIISDQGRGMGREELVKNFSIFGNKVARQDESCLGEFGIGRLSGFALAQRIEIVSRQAESTHANRLLWLEGKNQMQLFEQEDAPQGTSVKLVLKPQFLHLAKREALEAYIRRTFALLRKPILIGKGAEAINPSCEFVERSVRQAVKKDTAQAILWNKNEAQALLTNYYPQHQSLANYVHTALDGSQIFLSVGPISEVAETNGAQVFKKGVWVCETEDNFLPANFSFIKVLVNSPHLKLTATRNQLLPDDPIVHELPAYLNKQVFSFFTLLANDQPHILQRILGQYRNQILAYAISRLHWQHFLAQHYRFCGLSALMTWKDIVTKISAKNAKSRLVLVNTTAELPDEYEAAVISNEDLERDFIHVLATDTEVIIEEPDQNDPEVKENIALKLYCVSLLHMAISQLHQLGAEEAQISYLRHMCLQIQTKPE
ncbi:MAG: ATP-binding protein [Bacteroidota bacterium]